MHDFPVLAAALINQYHATHDPVLHALQLVIDKGAPLISSMSRLAGVTKGSIRALRGVKPSEDAAPVNLLLFLRVLDRISPDKRPRTDRKWRLFDDLLHWAGGASRGAIGSPKYSDDLVIHIVAGLMTTNEALLVRLLGANREHLNGIDDYLEYAGLWCATGAGEVSLCAHVKTGARRFIRDALMMRYAAPEILRQANCWHKELHNPANSLALNTSVPDEWPALPGLPHHFGGLTILPLTCSALLVAEGKQLEHCVGTYSDYCGSGESHVVSIRDAEGQRLSTAELSISETPDSRYALPVVQHHSFRNGPPSQACISALADYIQICSERAQAALGQLVEFHEQRNMQSGGVDFYDNEQSASTVCNILRQILPDYECARRWLLVQLDIEDVWYRINNERAAKALRQFRLDDTLSEKEAFEYAWDTGRWECLDAGLRPAMEW